MAPRIYFAHPKSDFGGTIRQKVALGAINDFVDHIDIDTEIVNPDAPEHQIGYAAKGMEYFREIVQSCDYLVFLRFPNGGIGAGVGREIGWAAAVGIPVKEAFNGKLYDCPSVPTPVLDIDETRATLRALAA